MAVSISLALNMSLPYISYIPLSQGMRLYK